MTPREGDQKDVGFERLTRNPDFEADGADHKRMKLPDGERPNIDIEGRPGDGDEHGRADVPGRLQVES